MHPVIMRQLAADHIREVHAKTENERLARQARRARRRTPSTRPGLPASGTLSYDDPRLDAGRRPVMHEQPSALPRPVMAGSPPDSAAASRGGCPSTVDNEGRESTDTPPVSTYSAPGGLRQDPGRAA